MIAQYKQMEHEEEMRILNLCDDVGITKEAIDSFRDYLFTPPKELQIFLLFLGLLKYHKHQLW